MATFQHARVTNTLFQAVTQRPLKVKIKKRSPFIWEAVHGIDPHKGQLLYDRLYVLEERLLDRVEEIGYADERTIAIYEKLSRAQRYDSIRAIYPAGVGTSTLMGDDGAIGASGDIVTAIRLVGEASNASSSASSSESDSSMSI